MGREFVPMPESVGSGEVKPDIGGDVQKARDAAEVQKHDTERIKAKQEAVFAEANIASVADLQTKLAEVDTRIALLDTEKREWANQKSAEQSEMQKQRAELEKEKSELNKKAQDIATREANVELREGLVSDREELMNAVERQKLDEAERYNSLAERIIRTLPNIKSIFGEVANTLIRSGHTRAGNGLWDYIEGLDRIGDDGIKRRADALIIELIGKCESCNNIAVNMARNPKLYQAKWWNTMVDSLEDIYKLLPDVKPKHLPSDKE